MKKNSQIHIWLETELKEKVEKQAQEEHISIGELCRQKLRDNSRTIKIEIMLEKLISILESRGLYKAKCLDDSNINS